MKAMSSIIVVIIVICMCAIMLVGCTDLQPILDKLDEQKNALDEYKALLEKYKILIDGHEDELIKVKERIEKLELAVQSIDEIKVAVNELEKKDTELDGKDAELENKIKATISVVADIQRSVDSLQSDLAKLETSEDSLKTQVTALQEKLNRIYFESDVTIDLSKTQEMLNKVYGLVIQDEYKLGDTIDIKLNGITYYTAKILVAEYHDGVVNKEFTDAMPACQYSTHYGPFHWCGYIEFTNLIFRTVNHKLMTHLIFPSWKGGSHRIDFKYVNATPGDKISIDFDIAFGEKKKLAFTFDYGFKPGSPFDIQFGLGLYTAVYGEDLNWKVAQIKNFYDGTTQPIIGENSSQG